MLRGKGFSLDGDGGWNPDNLEMKRQVTPAERVTLGPEVVSVRRFFTQILSHHSTKTEK